MTDLELRIASLADAEKEAVVRLWQACELTRPWNAPHADIALALRGANSTILIGRLGDQIVASVMVGHDGHRGWIYYVAVAPDHRRRGLGRAIMKAGEEWLKLRGIAKVELLIRPENGSAESFYRSLGYNVEPRIVMTRWLDGRDPTP